MKRLAGQWMQASKVAAGDPAGYAASVTLSGVVGLPLEKKG